MISSFLVSPLFLRGTDFTSPHGVPIDLLDRLLIIRTSTYSTAEMKSILAVRAEVEEISVDEEALEGLSQIGEQTSLRYNGLIPPDSFFSFDLVGMRRYAVQLLTPCKVLALTNGRDAVCSDDIVEINELFFDAKQSARILSENAGKYLQ